MGPKPSPHTARSPRVLTPECVLTQAPASKRGREGGPAGGGAPQEVLQHTQYCHLVPAPGLRTAYDTLLDGSFEDMLREVRLGFRV